MHVIVGEIGRYTVTVRSEEVRLFVAGDDEDDDAVVVATTVVGEDVRSSTRVDHVPGAEQQQRVERVIAQCGLELCESFTPQPTTVEFAPHGIKACRGGHNARTLPTVRSTGKPVRSASEHL